MGFWRVFRLSSIPSSLCSIQLKNYFYIFYLKQYTPNIQIERKARKYVPCSVVYPFNILSCMYAVSREPPSSNLAAAVLQLSFLLNIINLTTHCPFPSLQ